LIVQRLEILYRYEKRLSRGQIIPEKIDQVVEVAFEEIVEVLDFLMGYESYLRKRRISVSSRRYKPTGKDRHSLR
jgi:hypothetical protein